MASSDPEPSDFLTCLHCGALCLGPTVLPCGHLLCRKCVRQMAEEQASSPACPFCGQLVPRGQHSIREFLDSLGVDFVLEELVNQHLAQQDSIPCVACPDKIASKACLDCGEMCCQSCSNSHSKMRATKEHIQHDLLCVWTDEAEGHVCGEDTDSGTPQYNQSQLLFENLHQLKEKAAMLNSAQAIVTDLEMKVQKLNKRLSGDLCMLDFYNTRLSRPDIGVKFDVDALRPRLQRMLSECFVPDPAALDQMGNLMAGKTESGDGACDAYHCPDQRGISPKQTESKSTQSDPLPSASPSDVQPTESSDDANQESGQKLTLQFRLWEMEDERALLQEQLEEAETNNQQLTKQSDQLSQQVKELTDNQVGVAGMSHDLELLQSQLDEAHATSDRFEKSCRELKTQISSLTAALEKEQTAVKNMDKRQRKLDQLLSKEKAASQKVFQERDMLEKESLDKDDKILTLTRNLEKLQQSMNHQEQPQYQHSITPQDEASGEELLGGEREAAQTNRQQVMRRAAALTIVRFFRVILARKRHEQGCLENVTTHLPRPLQKITSPLTLAPTPNPDSPNCDSTSPSGSQSADCTPAIQHHHHHHQCRERQSFSIINPETGNDVVTEIRQITSGQSLSPSGHSVCTCTVQITSGQSLSPPGHSSALHRVVVKVPPTESASQQWGQMVPTCQHGDAQDAVGCGENWMAHTRQMPLQQAIRSRSYTSRPTTFGWTVPRSRDASSECKPSDSTGKTTGRNVTAQSLNSGRPPPLQSSPENKTGTQRVVTPKPAEAVSPVAASVRVVPQRRERKHLRMVDLGSGRDITDAIHHPGHGGENFLTKDWRVPVSKNAQAKSGEHDQETPAPFKSWASLLH